MVADFEKTRDELMSLVNDSNFANDFFPEYANLCNQLKITKEEVNKHKQRREEFEKWCNEGEIIDAEYRII